MCDAKYRFTYVDVVTPGRFSDGGTFDQCSLNAAMESGQLNIPSPTNLPGTSQPLPFVVVGDEAFPPKPWLMWPFPGRVLDSHDKKIYNYRLSRSRRTIENAFGIMTSRWRCLRDNTLVMSPDNAKRVILATCVLHNVLREQNINPYSSLGFADSIAPGGEIVEGIWRRKTPAHNRIQTNRSYSQDATDIRNRFKSYLTGLGAVEWQDAHVRRTQ
ncbi:putative nuclease HARBI1 [Watersipora subatra]|uniref:putative nuclease HARBI1 n=1 Tax=Watersipora subatra TaxID=2589382 RepID=UPI00355AD2D5